MEQGPTVGMEGRNHKTDLETPLHPQAWGHQKQKQHAYLPLPNQVGKEGKKIITHHGEKANRSLAAEHPSALPQGSSLNPTTLSVPPLSTEVVWVGLCKEVSQKDNAPGRERMM